MDRKKTAPTEAMGSIPDGGREAKTEIPVETIPWHEVRAEVFGRRDDR
jgi:hypothetical protein